LSLLHTPESGPVANSIKNKLEKAFTPVKLVLTDNSHLHLGHAEAKEAVESHFDLLIIAEIFQDESKISIIDLTSLISTVSSKEMPIESP